MAFDFGALVQGATRGLAGYRAGQMQGEDERLAREAAEAERAHRERVQLFNEHAKRKQMDLDAAALQQREKAANDLSTYRSEQNDLRRQVAEQGSWIQQQQAGPGGTVDRTNQSREGMNTQDNQTALEVARLRAEAAQRQALQKPETRPVPAGMAAQVGEGRGLETLVQAAQAAFDALPEGFDVTGPVRGRMTWLTEGMGWEDPKAVDFRQRLANINSTLVKARSGGAVTPQEFQRLEPFVPNKTDDEKVVRAKLEGLMRELKLMNQARVDALGDAGYDVNRFNQRAASGGNRPPSAVDPDAEWLAQYRKKRGVP